MARRDALVGASKTRPRGVCHSRMGRASPVSYTHLDVYKRQLQLLERFGCEVGYPANQTCCGQPMANSGYEHLTHDCNRLFVQNFADFDYIVGPSGSCVLHIKEHLLSLIHI